MKNYILLALFCLITLAAYTQSDKRVDSKIKSVTVFLSNAQVTREVKTRIEAGKTNLIVASLTAQLDPQSIQVTGKGRKSSSCSLESLSSV